MNANASGPDSTESDQILLAAPLVPDPYADEEMAARTSEAIADQAIEGSRLLIVRRVIEAVDFESVKGGAVKLVCTFQPSSGMRFTSANLTLELMSPAGARIIDLQPRQVREEHPVTYTVDRKGKIGVKYMQLEAASVEASASKQYSVYHCAVTAAGEGTSLASWVFTEDPNRKDGLGPEQELALTIDTRGLVGARVSVGARLIAPGLRGALESIRDLILPRPVDKHHYSISFEVPLTEPVSGLARFLRLS